MVNIMREEYNIEELNPCKNPYSEKLKNSNDSVSDEEQTNSDTECHPA